MRFALALLACLACGASAFVAPARAPLSVARSASASPALPLEMTSVNKKAKAACRKQKSSRSAAKRFKVTATGKLLRHYAGRSHLLRKKRPQALAKLRRVGQVDGAELDTYQRLLLVYPKRK